MGNLAAQSKASEPASPLSFPRPRVGAFKGFSKNLFWSRGTGCSGRSETLGWGINFFLAESDLEINMALHFELLAVNLYFLSAGITGMCHHCPAKEVVLPNTRRQEQMSL